MKTKSFRFFARSLIVLIFALFQTVPVHAATKYRLANSNGSIYTNSSGTSFQNYTYTDCNSMKSQLAATGITVICQSYNDAITCQNLGGACQAGSCPGEEFTGATDCGTGSSYCCGNTATTGCLGLTSHASGACLAGGATATCATGKTWDGNCSGTTNKCCVGSGAVVTTGTCSSQSGTCADISAGCPSGTSEIAGDCGSATQKCCSSSTTSPTGSSGSSTAGGSTIQFINPLKYDTVQEVLGVFLAYTQGVIVTIALVFLVLGGIFYIFSAGNEKNIGTAKKMITAAMIGLAIGIAAPSFLKEIAAILNWGNGTNNIPAEVNAAPSLMTIASNLLNFLLAMVGILAMLMIVVGGLMYFAAGGDEKKTDVAKNIVKFAIIGTAVALVSLIIVRTIATFFATT